MPLCRHSLKRLFASRAFLVKKLQMEKDKSNYIIALILAALVIIGVALIVMLKFDIPKRAINKLKAINEKEVHVYDEKIDIDGLEDEFIIYFIADSHISLCDNRDPNLKDYAKERWEYFKRDSKGSEKNFSILMEQVRKDNPDLVVFGGDIVDSISYASVDYVRKELDKLDKQGIPYAFCIGNHDFSYFPEYYSEKAYEEYMPRLSAFLDDYDSGYRILKYDDFNILIADDYNYRFCDNIVDAVNELQSENKQTIVVQHVPYAVLYNDSNLIEKTKAAWGETEDGRSRVLLGNVAIPPNEESVPLVSYCFNDSNVKLVLAGHVHFYSKDYMTENTIQVITKPAYERGAVKVTLY